MKKHTNIEQVGFINNKGKKELQMAGGEFCGNATRSAAYNYLKGTQGKIQICVNSKDKITAGVDKNKNAWSEIPLYKNIPSLDLHGLDRDYAVILIKEFIEDNYKMQNIY